MAGSSSSTARTPLEQELRGILRTEPERRLSWAQVMELALYHSKYGYYSGKPRRIGRGGDFYTAVSVGPLYGQLLGELALECWRDVGKPAKFTIIEQGAHDGTLMNDVWLSLADSDLLDALHLCLVEHRDACRSAQAVTLSKVLEQRVRWVSSVDDLPGTPGLLVCNELLDAFPVHRVRWQGGRWEEGFIVEGGENEELEWQWRCSNLAEIQMLPRDLPEGFITEVHPAATAWMRQVGRSAFTGPVLVADYGYEASEYYVAERSGGTLRRYRGHKLDSELLEALGESDLTAHVNFTSIIEAAAASGRRVERFLTQGRFLTQLAEPWLRSLEGRMPEAATRAQLRQFQTLTHPGHMGSAFRMLLLSGRS